MIGINFNALSFILYTLTRSQLPNNSSTCTAVYLYSIICSIISILNETSRTQTDPQSCAELARRPPNVRDRTQAAEYLLAVTHSSTTLGLRHVASISIVSRTAAIPAGSAFHACVASYQNEAQDLHADDASGGVKVPWKQRLNNCCCLSDQRQRTQQPAPCAEPGASPLAVTRSFVYHSLRTAVLLNPATSEVSGLSPPATLKAPLHRRLRPHSIQHHLRAPNCYPMTSMSLIPE